MSENIQRVDNTLEDLLALQPTETNARFYVNYVQLYANNVAYLRFSREESKNWMAHQIANLVQDLEGTLDPEVSEHLVRSWVMIESSNGHQYEKAGYGTAKIDTSNKKIIFRDFCDERHIRQILPYLPGWRISIRQGSLENFREEELLIYENKVIGRMYFELQSGYGEKATNKMIVLSKISEAELTSILNLLDPTERIFLRKEHPALYKIAQFAFNDRSADDFVSNEDIGIYLMEQGYKDKAELKLRDRRVFQLAKERGLIDPKLDGLLKEF